MTLSIVFAFVVGLFFTLNAISIQYCVRVGCDIDQANYDGNFWMFLVMFPGFMAVVTSDENPFTWELFFIGTLVLMLVTLGVIFIGQAYHHGDAGPNEAIKNFCGPFQAVLTAIVT